MGRHSRLTAIDTAAIHAELRRRDSLTVRLAAMRDRLQAKVVRVEAQIADLGGTPNGAVRARPATGRRRRTTGRGSRGPRPGSVVSLLSEALKGKTMTVTEAVAAVRKTGYKTKATAKSFYGAVAFALAQSGRFRRGGAGQVQGEVMRRSAPARSPPSATSSSPLCCLYLGVHPTVGIRGTGHLLGKSGNSRLPEALVPRRPTPGRCARLAFGEPYGSGRYWTRTPPVSRGKYGRCA